MIIKVLIGLYNREKKEPLLLIRFGEIRSESLLKVFFE